MNAVLAVGGEVVAGGGRDPFILLTQPLRGFERSTWLIVVINGVGGLLVAVRPAILYIYILYCL